MNSQAAPPMPLNLVSTTISVPQRNRRIGSCYQEISMWKKSSDLKNDQGYVLNL